MIWIRRVWPYILALTLFLIGSFLSFVLFFNYQAYQRIKLRTDFNHASQIQLYALQETIKDNLAQINYLKLFYASSSKVTSDEFHTFADYILNEYPGFLGIGTVSPHISPILKEPPSSPFLTFQSSHQQNSYFPLTNLALKQSEDFTITSDFIPSFFEDLQRAKEAKRPILSRPVKIHTTNTKQIFFIFDTVIDDRFSDSKASSLIAFFDLNSIIAATQAKINPVGIELYFYDITDYPTLLYYRPSRLVFLSPPVFLDWVYVQRFKLANRTWEIRAYPTMSFIQHQSPFYFWEILIAGIGLSALIAGYFLTLVNRRLLVEKEVQQRTEELDQINQKLQREIQEKQRIEENLTRKQLYLQKRHEALEYLTKFTTSELRNGIREVLLRTATVMQVERLSVWFFEIPYNHVLSCMDVYILSQSNFTNDPQLSIEDYPLYFQALQTHSQLMISSSQETGLTQELRPYLERFHIFSKLDIPVIFEGKLLGVLACEETRYSKEWSLEDRHFGQTIADVISLILEQAERRRAEHALQISEERLRFITQKAIDAIISVSENGTIASWNFGAEHMLGYKEDIIGQPLNTILPLHTEATSLNYLKQQEFRARHQDGHLFPVEVSYSRWQSAGQYFDTVIIRDITERKEYEKRLLNAIKEAQAANRSKSEFLAVVSHELRTPLNAIIGFNECLLLEIDGPINSEQKESLKKIEKSSLHLLELINDILDVAKIEASQLNIEINAHDLVEIVSTCVEELKTLARKKKLDIYFSTEQPHLIVHIDPLRIRQVCLNILGNAIKFTEKGYVKVEIIAYTEQVEIRVTDTGIGLTQEELKKLFKPFAQADSSITRRYGGTGLGLVISKQIIDLHGGFIKVESTKGKGSVFKIFLPLTHL